VSRCGRSSPIGPAFVERDGVRLHYEVYGSGPQTMLFIPPWSIVHSRVYKAQLPYFSGRFRCIAYDGRGNGKSDRPDRTEAYSLENAVADALASWLRPTRARPSLSACRMAA
jgi:pimeloyl-ACP methyl ester carboxylesterase